jgi:probable DNA metabolism protein
MAHIFFYDGSFEGFLTAVFHGYAEKLHPDRILAKSKNFLCLPMDGVRMISTDVQKADRVWAGLLKKVSPTTAAALYKTFLSEAPEVDMLLLEFFQKVFAGTLRERDFGDRAVLAVQQWAKKVHREKHRMEAFVRFQRTSDDLYYAAISPDFNVIPLLSRHFFERYKDQDWIIYDVRRRYGIYYNKETGLIEQIELNFNEGNDQALLPRDLYHESEVVFQRLWKDYFTSVNISSRKNLKLHKRHVPVRYWQFLIEKR